MYAPENGHQFYIYTIDNKLTPISDSQDLVEVKCTQVNKTTCPIPILQDYFKDYETVTEVILTGREENPLHYPLHIFHYPTGIHKEFPVNKAVKKITQYFGSNIIWNGPVLVMRFKSFRRRSYCCGNKFQVRDNNALWGYVLDPTVINGTSTIRDVVLYPVQKEN